MERSGCALVEEGVTQRRLGPGWTFRLVLGVLVHLLVDPAMIAWPTAR